jgi:ubiquinone/menaquinone biosynthesis C-methylase UbiE
MKKEMNDIYSGDGSNFDANWRHASESKYLHWTKGEITNQIQLAFRNHWLTFQDLLSEKSGGKRRVLEVGCGRGSLSAYFSDAGWDCTLLDISPKAIELAKNAFAENNLEAKFDVGDCLHLPYKDGSFDLVFSIGLLEHFQDINSVIKEQKRILADSGMFIGYVVPECSSSIQAEYSWVCEILKDVMGGGNRQSEKSPIYRSDYKSDVYIDCLKRNGFKNIKSTGIYSLPMVSNSIEFPFSLLPPKSEKILVKYFSQLLEYRRMNMGGNPWLCREDEGQAFLVWGNV